MNATDKVRLVLRNSREHIEGAKVIARRVLDNADRFQEEPPYNMIDYDKMVGDALKAWIMPREDGSLGYQVMYELAGIVEWAEIGQEIHSEVAVEYAEMYPEYNIYLPKEDQ